jgi:hypothetical protein
MERIVLAFIVFVVTALGLKNTDTKFKCGRLVGSVLGSLVVLSPTITLSWDNNAPFFIFFTIFYVVGFFIGFTFRAIKPHKNSLLVQEKIFKKQSFFEKLKNYEFTKIDASLLLILVFCILGFLITNL